MDITEFGYYENSVITNHFLTNISEFLLVYNVVGIHQEKTDDKIINLINKKNVQSVEVVNESSDDESDNESSNPWSIYTKIISYHNNY
ncbi:hypothetical protein BpHYR1_026788 [Brachionus plicatilis]|uniref:Uncharacterized protein n=1 Tax=Brachionus plicatilis TaxID=10195 RepID=A0A3M7QNQ1_BRAPC|nr:hypothetical protein BpHYR1_026788 [Brachionus plicatilis]